MKLILAKSAFLLPKYMLYFNAQRALYEQTKP